MRLSHIMLVMHNVICRGNLRAAAKDPRRKEGKGVSNSRKSNILTNKSSLSVNGKLAHKLPPVYICPDPRKRKKRRTISLLVKP